MVAMVGTYQNGYVKLDKEFASDSPVKVIVTFLENISPEPGKLLSLSDFSFAKSQTNLAHYKGSFSEAVIADRKTEL